MYAVAARHQRTETRQAERGCFFSLINALFGVIYLEADNAMPPITGTWLRWHLILAMLARPAVPITIFSRTNPSQNTQRAGIQGKLLTFEQVADVIRGICVGLCMCVCVHPSVCLSVCLFACLSVCPSGCLAAFTCLCLLCVCVCELKHESRYHRKII